MLARTDALMSQAETGKIAPRPSSPLWPVVTRRAHVQENAEGGAAFRTYSTLPAGHSHAAPRTPLESPCRARSMRVASASEKA